MVGDLFAGIGGFSLGLERSGGFEIAWQIEIDPYCQKVLAKHWPDVTRYGDIRDCGEGRAYALSPVDVLCGGFPCQPHSLAGRRKASTDERDLWPEFSRLICELRPAWVLAENVPGLLTSDAGRFFGGILRDLAEIGYDAQWTVLSAAQFGAPHQRERIFIVAYPISARSAHARDIDFRPLPRRQEPRWQQSANHAGRSGESSALADAASQQQPGHQARVLHGQRGQHTGDGQEVVRRAHRQAGTDLARSDDESVADPKAQNASGAGIHGEGGLDLQTATKRWALPNTVDAKGGNRKAGNQVQLCHQAAPQPGSNLNPDWVECLQGFPVSWTDIDGLPGPVRVKRRGSRREW